MHEEFPAVESDGEHPRLTVSTPACHDYCRVSPSIGPSFQPRRSLRVLSGGDLRNPLLSSSVIPRYLSLESELRWDLLSG